MNVKTPNQIFSDKLALSIAEYHRYKAKRDANQREAQIKKLCIKNSMAELAKMVDIVTRDILGNQGVYMSQFEETSSPMDEIEGCWKFESVHFHYKDTLSPIIPKMTLMMLDSDLALLHDRIHYSAESYNHKNLWGIGVFSKEDGIWVQSIIPSNIISRDTVRTVNRRNVELSEIILNILTNVVDAMREKASI